MHTVELYDAAKGLAESMGYQVREENLGGVGGGACVVAGKQCVFVDVAMTSVEQLDQIVLAISGDPTLHAFAMPAELREYFPMLGNESRAA